MRVFLRNECNGVLMTEMKKTCNGAGRIVKAMLLVLTLFAVFGLAFVPLRGSQDEWWHLKTGMWIVQNGGLPTNDIFTYTGEHLRWYNHEWLSQVTFYLIYRVGEVMGGDGLLSLILFKSIIVAMAFGVVALLARQRGLLWPAACVLALVTADISRRTIHARPPIFSYLLLAVFLYLLYRWKQGRLRMRWLWALVPLTVVWGNLHGMVLLAFVATGAFAGGELLENVRRWWLARKSGEGEGGAAMRLTGIFSRPFWGLTALTAALVLAAMCQPSGYHLFLLGRNFTADPLLQEIILEMKPTPGPLAVIDSTQPLSLDNLAMRSPGFWTFWVALAVTAYLFLRNRGRLRYGADYLLLGFFTYQAVAHWRLLPLFAITAAGPVAGLLADRLALAPRVHRRAGVLFTGLLVALIGWFNFTVAEPPPETFFRRNLQMLRGETSNLSDYPAPLMDYLVESGLPPNMFSDSNYCGYAMWRLAPETYKLFTDNRFDLFGSEFIKDELTVFYALHRGDVLDGRAATESWRNVLQRNRVNFLVFRPIDRPHLHEAVLRSGDWRLVYYYIPPRSRTDEWPLNGNHVWLRKSAETPGLVRQSREIFDRQFPGFIKPAELEEQMRRALPALPQPTTADASTTVPIVWETL